MVLTDLNGGNIMKFWSQWVKLNEYKLKRGMPLDLRHRKTLSLRVQHLYRLSRTFFSSHILQHHIANLHYYHIHLLLPSYW